MGEEKETREGNVRLYKIQIGFLCINLITRELGLEKQKIKWGIRTRKFEEKLSETQ